MKTQTWTSENGGWQGRAGTPLPAAARRGLRALPLRFCVSAVMLWFGLLISQAQTYSIDWYKISGGGGTSTNGQYTVSGTIGQPDASGTMTGGNYSLTSGFWSLISVVQTPGAPTLTVAHSGNGVTVSWPLTTGFELEQNSDLSTTNWTVSAFAVSTNGTLESVSVKPSAGNLFFRLARP